MSQTHAHESGVMSILKEFKEFTIRGNVVDLAVAVVIGAAFGRIVTSLVEDIIMPPLGLLLGGVDFQDYYIALKGEHLPTLAAAREAGTVALSYGQFLNVVVNFVIIALAIFMVIKAVNHMRRKEAEAPAPSKPTAPPAQELLLMEIRDAIKAQNKPS